MILVCYYKKKIRYWRLLAVCCLVSAHRIPRPVCLTYLSKIENNVQRLKTENWTPTRNCLYLLLLTFVTSASPPYLRTVDIVTRRNTAAFLYLCVFKIVWASEVSLRRIWTMGKRRRRGRWRVRRGSDGQRTLTWWWSESRSLLPWRFFPSIAKLPRFLLLQRFSLTHFSLHVLAFLLHKNAIF